MAKAKKVLTIRQERNRALRMIMEVLDLVMWDSGYRTEIEPGKGIIGNSRPLRLWVPRWDNKGHAKHPGQKGPIIKINGYVAQEIEGFCEHGVITDTHGGGLVWQAWSEYPVEDLLKIERYCYKIEIGFSL